MPGTPEQQPLSDQELRALYAWIDAIPLSRPKRNIGRDFADGVMLAEVVAAYFPALVELHNYAAANSVKQKVYNFETLNQRVLRKLGYQIPRSIIDDIVACRPGAVEGVLNVLQLKMAKYREKKANSDSESVSPSVLSYQQPKSAQMQQQQQQAPATQQQPRSAKGPATNPKPALLKAVDDEILLEKEQQVRELQETVEILELKIAKLEQLVRLKDNKIAKLMGGK